MADENVNVVYTADTTQYTQSLNEAVGATEKYAMMADNAAGKIGKLGITTAKVIQSGFGLKPQDITPARRTAAAYEQSLSLISARAKLAGQNVNQLGKDVRAMARDFPIGLEGSKQQFQVIQQAGKSGRELAQITKEMVKLGAATGEIGPDLTQSMVQFTRTFDKFEPEKIEDISDSVTTLSATMGTSASTMLDFANTVSPLAKQLGSTATDVLGFSTAFARAGESGARSANVFNTMLQDMERGIRTGAPQMRSYAEALQMTTSEFRALATSDPTEAMTQFFESIVTQGDEGIRILEDLGFEGVRSMKAITQVAQTGGIRPAIEEANRAFASGATGQVAGEAFKGLADSMDKTRESMTQLVEASGRPMLGMMTDLSNAAGATTSAFAGFVNSPPVQMALTAGLLMRGMGGAAGTVLSVGSAKTAANWGAGALGRLTERAVGSPVGQFAAQYRPQIMTAAGAGAAMGMMAGSPTLMLGSMAAYMMMSNAPGYLNKIRSLGTSASNTFLNDPRMLVPMRAGLMGDQMQFRSNAFNLGARLQQWRAGIAPEFQVRPDMPGGVWSARGVKSLEEAIRSRDFLSGGALTGRQQFGRSLLAGAGQTALAAGSLLGPLFSVPGALLMGGIGAAYGGYKMYKSTKETEASTESDLSRFSAATGIATKGLEDLNLEMQHLSESVQTVSDAMKVSEADIEAAGNAAYEAMLPKKYQGMSVEETAKNLYATYGNQSAEMWQRVKTDLLSYQPAENVRQVMSQVGQMQQEQKSPTTVARELNAENYTFWDKTWNNIFGTYFGKREATERAQAAGVNVTQRYTELAEAGGREAVINEISTKGIEEAITVAMNDPDRGAAQKQIMALLETDIEGADKTIDAIKGLSSLGGRVEREKAYFEERGMEFKAGSYVRAQNLTEFADLATAMGMSHDELEKWINEAGKLPSLEEVLFSEKGVLGGLTKEKMSLQATSGMRVAGMAAGGVYGMADLAEAFAITKETGQTLDQLYEEEKTARQEGRQGKLGAGAYVALGGYAQPENETLRASAAMRVQMDAMSDLAAGSEVVGERVKNSVEWIREIAKGGEIPAKDIKGFTDMMTGLRQGVEMMAGSEISLGEARDARRAANEAALVGLEREGNAIVIDDQTELAQEQLTAIQDQNAIDQEIFAERRQFLTAWRQQQQQAAFSRSEFGIQSGIARRDAGTQEARQRAELAKQETRARQDQARAAENAWDDYHKQVARMNRDYSKNLIRAQDDFATSMLRSQQDYTKQSERMWDDYYRGVERATEDFVTSMTDPSSRMGIGRVWSAQGMAANLAEQTQLITEQFDILDDLRERGLSQDVIDTLQLANPQNAMQTRSLVGMSQEDIDALNQQMEARAGIGERAYEEQLSARRAEEDIFLSAERAEIDYIEGVQRATDDFNKEISRMAEDFATSLTDMYDDLVTSIGRAEEELTITLTRSAADLNEQLGYMYSDLNLHLADAEAALDRSIANSAAMLKASFDDIVMNAEQSQSLVNSALETGYVNFSGHIETRLDDTTSNIRQTSSQTTSSVNAIASGASTAMDPLFTKFGGVAVVLEALGVLAKGTAAKYGLTMNSAPSGGTPYYDTSKQMFIYPQLTAGQYVPHAEGGITKGTLHMIGEAGPELIMPLDANGATFLGDLLSKYQTNNDVRAARTSAFAMNHSINASTTINDSSVKTGNVTVVSGDPDDMGRKLRAKARQAALASKV